MRKRQSITSNEEIMKDLRDRTGFSAQELEQYLQKFSRFDQKQNGILQKEDTMQFFKETNQITKPEIKKWLTDQLQILGTKPIDFKVICDLAVELRKYNDQLEEEEQINGEYVDAFVAMGGNADRSGYVSKETIINIIKNEFELSYNMEAFLDGFGEQKQLDFESFSQLFEQGGDDAKSMLTAFSERGRKTFGSSSFHVRYKDFEKWISEN